MVYKVIIANTFYVEAGSEAEARLRVIGDLAGVGSENMLVTEVGEEFLGGEFGKLGDVRISENTYSR